MAKPPLLEWDFDGEGMWESASALTDDGATFCYRIIVCDDGTFDVSESDPELVGMKRKFQCLPSLTAAKEWCEGEEAATRADMGKQS